MASLSSLAFRVGLGFLFGCDAFGEFLEFCGGDDLAVDEADEEVFDGIRCRSVR